MRARGRGLRFRDGGGGGGAGSTTTATSTGAAAVAKNSSRSDAGKSYVDSVFASSPAPKPAGCSECHCNGSELQLGSEQQRQAWTATRRRVRSQNARSHTCLLCKRHGQEQERNENNSYHVAAVVYLFGVSVCVRACVCMCVRLCVRVLFCCLFFIVCACVPQTSYAGHCSPARTNHPHNDHGDSTRCSHRVLDMQRWEYLSKVALPAKAPSPNSPNQTEANPRKSIAAMLQASRRLVTN